MTEHEINSKVKSAFTSDIPDNFDEILAKCEAQDKIIAMPQRRWNVKRMRRIIGAAAVAVVVFAVGITGYILTNGNNTDSKFFSDSTTDDSIKNQDFFVDNAYTESESSADNITSEQHGGTNTNTVSDKEHGNGSSSTNNGIPQENLVGGNSWKDILNAMPKKLRGSSLTFYNWDSSQEYAGAPGVIEKFTQQTGIAVKWQTIPYDSYFTNLAAVIASGKNVPDVVRTRGPVPSDMLCYQPLTTAKFDFSDSAWDKSIMELYTINGKTYATSLQNTHLSSVDLIFYNNDLIKKYDMEDPYKLWKTGKWNWEKYLEICRNYTNESGNPASCGEGWYRSYPSVFGTHGAIGFDGKQFFNNMKNKNFSSLYGQLANIYNEDKLFVFGGADQFAAGKSLFAIGTSSQMRKNNSAFAELKSENNLCAVPMPAPKGDKHYTQGLAEAEAYAIAKGASNPEAAPYFLRYFLDGSNYDLNNYFCNSQNLEVYNWCTNQNNKIFVYSYPETVKTGTTDGFKEQTSDDIAGFIDANINKIDNVVKEYNGAIEKLNK